MRKEFTFETWIHLYAAAVGATVVHVAKGRL